MLDKMTLSSGPTRVTSKAALIVYHVRHDSIFWSHQGDVKGYFDSLPCYLLDMMTLSSGPIKVTSKVALIVYHGRQDDSIF